MSHSIEKHPRGNLLCFRRNRLSKHVLHRKGISLTSLGNHLSHSAEIFVHGPFYVSKKFWHPKSLRIKGTREITNLRRRVDVSQYRKISQPNPSVFQKKCRVSKNFMHKKEIPFFVLIIFCPTESKSFVGEHVCLSKISGIENFYGLEKRLVYNDFLSKFLSHSTENCREGTLLCFRKFRVSKIVLV